MKKLMLLLAAFAFAAACKGPVEQTEGSKDPVTTESVDPTRPDDSSDPGTSVDPTVSDDPTVSEDPDVVLSQQEIKEKLNEIGIELVSYADLDYWSDAFYTFGQFGMRIAGMDEKGNAYNTEAIQMNLVPQFETTDVDGEGYEVRTVDIKFSEFKGKYTLPEGATAWGYEPADNLQFVENIDGDEVAMTARITDYPNSLYVEGYKEDYYSKRSDWESLYIDWTATQERWDVKGSDDYYMWRNPVTNEIVGPYSQQEGYNIKVITDVSITEEHTKDYTYLYMPKTIDATLFRGGDSLMDVAVSVEYEDMFSDQILDLDSDRLSVTASLDAGPYNLSLNRVFYSPENADVDAVFKCNDTQLVHAVLSETGFMAKRGVTEHESSDEGEDLDGDGTPDYEYRSYWWRDSYLEPQIPTLVEADIDVLGKMQIKGKVNLVDFVEFMNKAMDTESEAAFKSYVGQAEDQMELNVYFGGNAPSAHLGLEPDRETIDGNVDFRVVPVIRFDDGTAYVLFEDFFTQENFQALMEAFYGWYEKVGTWLHEVGFIHDEDPMSGTPGDLRVARR
ncbi:MAG: hypothetical protein IJ795_04890 [Bacteroidales bacterium]|nr:hypothetical protein [Bacteroidales bacterium]